MSDAKVENEATKQEDICVKLIDGVFDMAIDGKVHSIAMVIVTEPGKYRIVAAGPDVDGMEAGARALHDQFKKLLGKDKPIIAVQ